MLECSEWHVRRAGKAVVVQPGLCVTWSQSSQVQLVLYRKAHGSLWVKRENLTGLSEGVWKQAILYSIIQYETLSNITICLCLYDSLIYLGLKEKCVDSLVFETLIPKPMMQHYISLLLKHRRLVLSGPSGTGKSYLASRLAEYLVDRSAREVTTGIAVTFNMHRQSCKVIQKWCP